MAQNFYSSVPNKNDVVFDDLTKMNENFNTLRSSFSGDTQPESAVAGQLWFDTSSGTVKYYTGSDWKSITGTATSLGVYTANEETSWTTCESLPVTLGAHGAVYYNSKIYIFGGQIDTTPTYNTTMYEYDIATNTYTAKANSTYTHAYPAFGLIDGKIYVVGGRDDYKHEVYDIANDAWSEKADYPIANVDICGSGVYNGKLYVFGGYDGTNYYSETYEYDPATDSWTAKTSMPVENSNMAFATIGKYIFSFGGRNSSEYLNSCYRYDTENDTWTTIANYPFSGNAARAVKLSNTKIIICGGWDDGTSANTDACYVYDIILDTFTATTSLDEAKRIMAVAYDEENEDVYVIGGWTSESVNTVIKRKKSVAKKVSLDVGEGILTKEDIIDKNSYLYITDSNAKSYGNQLAFAEASGDYYVELDKSAEIIKISK